jgi:hypothetical protein
MYCCRWLPTSWRNRSPPSSRFKNMKAMRPLKTLVATCHSPEGHNRQYSVPYFLRNLIILNKFHLHKVTFLEIRSLWGENPSLSWPSAFSDTNLLSWSIFLVAGPINRLTSVHGRKKTGVICFMVPVLSFQIKICRITISRTQLEFSWMFITHVTSRPIYL